MIHIENPHESRNTEDLARELIETRTFAGWPFLQEAMVVGLSDSTFKYEKESTGPRSNVVSSKHSGPGSSLWKNKAEKIEGTYSRKCGVLTGQVKILLHVRPLKGAESKLLIDVISF